MSASENESPVVSDVDVDPDAPVLDSDGIDYSSLTQRKKRKYRFRRKLIGLLAEFKNVLVVKIDNVGSNQMQIVRKGLRGKAEMLMGKNTMIRKVVRENLDKFPKFEGLLPFIRGNVGFVFTNSDLLEVRDMITENKVPASAKSGALAPVDVYVQPGPTGLDPGQTSFFQALNIGTKIMKGSIEIINTVHLIKKGDKVTASAVALLSKLNLKPFFYGIVATTVFENGSVYDASILDLSDADLLKSFFSGVRNVAALSIALSHPTQASLPHTMINAFKRLVAISLETEWVFEESKIYKEMLDNPDAFKGKGGEEEEEEEEEEESEEEDESDGAVGGGGMFGGDDDDY